MTARRKKPAVTPVPNLHFVMIIVVAMLTAVSATAYGFVPADRADLYKQMVCILLGCLVGKLTNSFGKTPDFRPTVDPTEQPDEEVKP